MRRSRRRTEYQADFGFGRDTSAAAQQVYTVSQLTAEIKLLIETAHPAVYVRGEISNFHHHGSGHMYFSLKDEGAQIGAAFFRGANRGLKFDPENGMEVIAFGRLSVYEPRGNYQIVVEHLEPAGVGALQQRIEQLKKKLDAEGLFDEGRKRPIPRFPREIAVVTSPEAAAVKDFLKVSRRRFPGQHIVIFPTLVQGDEAPPQIVRAIEDANAMGGFDVLVVTRGGGSIEDLMAFNDEAVARAIAASEIPTVTGIGHERDFTIADFVADLRAATPSNAAELVTPSREEMAGDLDDLKRRLERHATGLVEDAMQALDDMTERAQRAVADALRDLKRTVEEMAARIRSASPWQMLKNRRQLLEQLSQRMVTAAGRRRDEARQRLQALAGKLGALSPLGVLERGYSIAFSLPERRVIKDAAQVKPGQDVEVKLARGGFRATAHSAEGKG